MTAAHIHDFCDVVLQSGETLRSARLAFTTHGALSPDKDNAILFPTWFGGNHAHNEWIIGPERALDPARHFIVVVNLLGNGQSSSPSNSPGDAFPLTTVLDNVILQQRLLVERWGIERLKLVVGRSMGAQVAFQWGCWFPDRMDAILPFVGSARTAPHNRIFLDNVAMAAEAPSREEAHRRLALVFDAWGLSQGFYRKCLQQTLGFATLEDYLARTPPDFGDPRDVLAQVRTWRSADLSANDRFGGDYAAALGAIRARCIVMPGRTDLYFPPEDSEIEVSLMPNAQLRVIESLWGHRAGAPDTDPADTAVIEAAIRELLGD